jgi:hypothetical protein
MDLVEGSVPSEKEKAALGQEEPDVEEHRPLQKLWPHWWECETVREWKSKTLDDCDTTGAPGNLTMNRSGRAGLKGGADVAVGEDHRGGTVSQ